MGLMLRFESEGRSDTGRVRDHNEDSLLCRPKDGLWVVADGMGGHERGEWASAVVTEAIAAVHFGADDDFDKRLALVSGAIHAANRRIYTEGTVRNARFGTTVVALLLHAGRFGVLWAGDSRAYVLRHGVLHQLTIDHTEVQRLLDLGMLQPGEAHSHPMGHLLARAIGVMETVSIDAITDNVLTGDRYLLCSDGLTGVIKPAELQTLLGTGSITSVADRLIERTLAGGAPDNVTIALVDAREATRLTIGEPAGSLR